MPSKNKKPLIQGNSSVRIIAGRWRGRKLTVGSEDGLRPSGDRLRETLFNWLAPFIHGARCLDAFAGTGALGFEALSRGAESVQFIEKNPRTIEHLRHNTKLLQCCANISGGSFTSWQATEGQVFDLIFLDPPFQADLWQQAFSHIQAHIALKSEALVYIESPKTQVLDVPADWSLHKQKTFGQVRAMLYKTTPHDPS